MILLRWEVVPLLRPWAAPQSSLLGAPIASGTIIRDDWDPATGTTRNDPAVLAPADPVAIPAAVEGATFHMLVLEAFGGHDWLVTLADPYHPSQPIQACDGVLKAADVKPFVLVPASYAAGGRSREIRAVIPGSSFVARPRIS